MLVAIINWLLRMFFRRRNAVKMTNYDPTVVVREQVDAIVGYASNQPQSLKAHWSAFAAVARLQDSLAAKPARASDG